MIPRPFAQSRFALAFPALVVPALALFAQTSGPALSAPLPAPNLGTSSGADSTSHSHHDSTGLVLLGLAAGGAALLGGGSHGHSDSGDSASLAPAVLGPQIVWTQTPPAASAPASAPSVVISHLNAAKGTQAAPIAAAPVVVFTYPTSVPPEPLSTVSVWSGSPAAPTPATVALSQGSSPAPSIAASAPEPATTVTGAVGGFLLGGLLLRARRRSAAGAC